MAQFNKKGSEAIKWHSDGHPISELFDDIYFSVEDGLAETRYVFLDNNHLKERWQTSANLSNRFTIAETGFGTGLNFLATAHLWLANSQKHQCLHYISVEKYPLSPDAIHQALSHWPELKELLSELLANYPKRVQGLHERSLFQGRIKLTLLFNDATTGFSQLKTKVDAWFLDGFAPSKNPEMWTPLLFQQIARLSRPQTTFSTFTAAGVVKRGLHAEGFCIEKIPGYGKKREMLRGIYTQHQGPIKQHHRKIWFYPPEKATDSIRAENRVIIIGAGLAGTSTAYSLSRRGYQVTLLDQNPEIAQGASGNKQGILYTKVALDDSLHSRFYLSGYQYSLHLFQKLQAQSTQPSKRFWFPTGMTQLATQEKEQKRQNTFRQKEGQLQDILSFETTESLSNIHHQPIHFSGLHFPDSGWISPQNLCQAYLELSPTKITFKANFKVLSLKKTSTEWEVIGEYRDQEDKKSLTTKTKSITFKAPTIILANAFSANQLLPSGFTLPIKSIRGQTTMIPKKWISKPIKHVFCSQGYITPCFDDHYCIGATFNLRETSSKLREEDHRANILQVNQMMPNAINHQSLEHEVIASLTGRVGFRCATGDYTPIIGAVPDQPSFLKQYSHLMHDKTWQSDQAPKYLDGLYLNIGHGSKGLASTPLCAEILASMIHQEPLPLEHDLIETLMPSRFLIRKLIRGEINT